MTKITLDSTLRLQLPDLTKPYEICNEAGNTVGQYVPANGSSKGQTEPQISREEIERRKQNKGRAYSSAEVISHLENL